jgi:VWFA-related protein
MFRFRRSLALCFLLTLSASVHFLFDPLRAAAGSAAVVSSTSGQTQGSSQAAQKPPVFRSSVSVVPLTVSVLDRKGLPVTDLRQSDFTVIEDGQPREIVAFYSQAGSFVPQPALAAQGASLNRADRDVTAPETRRTFVIALGFGRIQYPTKAVDGALQFVREQLLPQDLVAVMAFNRATDFTTDHAAVARFLERYKRDHERIEFDVNQFWVHNRYDPLSKSLQAAIDAVFLGPLIADTRTGDTPRHDGTVRHATTMLVGMNDTRGIRSEPWEAPATFGELSRAAFLSRWNLSDLMVRGGLLKVYAGLEYLRHLDGQKHLVFLGPGLGLTSKEDDERLARRFNGAGAALHVIRTAGVPAHQLGPVAAAAAFASLSEIQGLQNVTALTGGQYTGVSYANRALASIDRASRSSYVIGYVPGNPERDGRYRSVTVKVARPGVVARFPDGYYAAERPEPLSMADLVTQSRMESAMYADVTATDISVTAEATYRRIAGGVEVSVAGRIDASRLTFTQRGFLKSVRLGLTVTGLDAKRQWIGATMGQLANDVNDDTFLEYTLSGVPFSVRFPVTSVPKSVRVVVYDYGSDLMGSVNVAVR